MTGRWKSLYGEALNQALSWASPVSVYKADLLLMARIFLRPLLSSQCRTSSQLCHAPGRERTGKWLLSPGRNIMAYWTLAYCWFIASAIIRLASHRLIDGWFSLFADGRQADTSSSLMFDVVRPCFTQHIQRERKRRSDNDQHAPTDNHLAYLSASRRRVDAEWQSAHTGPLNK